jgi:hypothetical protein
MVLEKVEGSLGKVAMGSRDREKERINKVIELRHICNNSWTFRARHLLL